MVVSTYRSSPFQNIPDSQKRNQSRIANLESTSGNRVFFGMIYIFSFESFVKSFQRFMVFNFLPLLHRKYPCIFDRSIK